MARAAVWTVRNWDAFQHYNPRKRSGSPPWIKLYRSLLDDREFRSLSVEARDLLRDLWLIAAERGGDIPADPAWIAWRLRAASSVLANPIRELLTAGFIEGSAEMLERRYQDASTSLAQIRGEEKREEEKDDDEGARVAAAVCEQLPAEYHEALRGTLRAARNPAAVAATIKAMGRERPGKGRKAYAWAVIGHALQDMLANGEAFTARRLEVFCAQLDAAPTPSNGGAVW